LSDLDGAFPAYQMADDWKKYPSQNHEFKSESPPTLRVFRKNSELLDAIFASAQREANLLGGRQVAVLCSNDELFKKYLSVGRINDKFSAISSRDEISDLRYVRTKPVFSMPQYVSGLQFNTVYMLHIDRDDLLDGSTETERRRFVTRCYSGASRAVNTLQVASSEERGGPSPILKSALQRGSIVQI
jgi:hypothetical protein